MTKKTKKSSKTDRPPRRRRAKLEEAEDEDVLEGCSAPGCTSPALADGEFCLIHFGLDIALDKLQTSMKSNDVTGALMGGLGLLLFQPRVSDAFGAAAQRVASSPPSPSPSPPPRTKLNPFKFLGLDPTKATPEDVQRVQRALAKLYHVDTGAGGVDPRRMAEVNAAAAACLQALRQHRG